jgi:uncharacterized protein
VTPLLKALRIPIGITVAALAITLKVAGMDAATVVAILAILEISFSVDNAVLNAGVLKRMSPLMQRLFLTVGIAVAVFGVRGFLPLLIVSMTANVGIGAAFDMALHQPDHYATALTAAHPAIVGFGVIFLEMVFLDWLFDEERDVHWIAWIERPFSKMARISGASAAFALLTLGWLAFGYARDGEQTAILIAGLAAVVIHVFIAGISDLFNVPGVSEAVSKAATGMFVYLEILDASLSMDGVIGAFAITSNFIIILVGTGLGACYVRGLTVYMVQQKILDVFIHLDHGAHWAIGSLAALLAVTLRHEIPDVVTGFVGVAFLAAAVVTSLIHARRNPAPAPAVA